MWPVSTRKTSALCMFRKVSEYRSLNLYTVKFMELNWKLSTAGDLSYVNAELLSRWRPIAWYDKAMDFSKINSKQATYIGYIRNAETTETHRNPMKPTETHRNPPNPTETHWNPPKPTGIHRNPPKPVDFDRGSNSRESKSAGTSHIGTECKAKLFFTFSGSTAGLRNWDWRLYKDISSDVREKFDKSKFGILLEKKIPWLIKDEAGGKIVEEFVCLRSTLYCYKMYEWKTKPKEEKSAKEWRK